MSSPLPASLLPWQQQDWVRLSTDPDRLHHAMLLTGISGIGKREFALALAQSIICSGADEGAATRPCSQCQNCRLFAAGTHPDVHILLSEREAVEGRQALFGQYADRYQDAVARDKKANPAMVIPVDQIRQLIDRFYQASHISARRVALIVPADRMNVNAANALLKLLEEPPENAHFLLVTADPSALPATIRSRCVTENLAAPDRQSAMQWLQQSDHGGQIANDLSDSQMRSGPLDYLAQHASGYLDQQNKNIRGVIDMINGRIDPVELAAVMAKQDNAEVLVWFQQFCSEIIKWYATGDAQSWPTGQLPAKMHTDRLFSVYDKISNYRRLAREQLNGQLALEEVLLGLNSAAR